MSICFFIYFISYLFFTIDIYIYRFKKPDPHKIEIIEIISKEYDNENNILKFLKNKILYSDDIFEEYNRPVKIRFRYKNYIYCICLKNLSSRNNKTIISEPEIMLAQIKKDNELIDITKKIRELHGHSKNYYEHIPGCYNNYFFMILEEYSGNTLEIMDMYGKIIRIRI